MKYSVLNESQVIASRKEHGVNLLTPPEKESLWKQFVQTLTGPLGHLIPGWENGDSLVFILEIAALLSGFISFSEYYGWLGLEASYDAKVFFEPVGIIMAIVLATGISFYFEVKANREFEILNQVNDDEPVKVIRSIDGKEKVVAIPRRDIVVGDVLMLSTGEEVPADCELLEATSLSIDESTLTGEPICHKTVNEAEFDTNATFPSNHVMRGTKVMEGHCVCRVFAVGDKTENGKVFTAAQITDNVKTPLDEQFDRLGFVISVASYIIGIVVFVGRIIAYLHTGNASISDPQFLPYALQSLMIAVTLVVCAVPEGLPMAVSLSLALSMRRMLKTNNLVRKIHACETMGATTVICTDKTGTLTQNKMQVSEIFPEFGEDMKLNMAINSTAIIGVDSEGNETILGNPTEGALLLYLRDNGVDYAKLRSDAKVIDEVPFSTERKYMATTIEQNGNLMLVKGAPEIVMDMCDSFSVPRAEIETKLLEYQSKGMRTLGFAISESPLSPSGSLPTGEGGGRGRSLIISRARPMDKKRLVETLQSLGDVVAVTGDGTNDAPALKAAHVGLSMGDGTSVAKEASDITIIDNSFSSIGRAVMWGRSLYQNIQRFILFQLTVNVVACLIVLAGAFMGTESPLTVTQMLWVNLIMDTFAAMALASLPPSKSVMYDKPRNRRSFIITRKMMASILLTGGFMFAILFCYLRMGTPSLVGLLLPSGSLPTEGSPMLSTSEYVKSGGRGHRGLVFCTFVLFQFWNLFNARAFSTGHSAFRLKGCKGFLGIAAIIFFGQIAIMNLLPDFFNVEPIGIMDWLIIIVGTSVVLVAGEIVRLFSK